MTQKVNLDEIRGDLNAFDRMTRAVKAAVSIAEDSEFYAQQVNESAKIVAKNQAEADAIKAAAETIKGDSAAAVTESKRIIEEAKAEAETLVDNAKQDIEALHTEASAKRDALHQQTSGLLADIERLLGTKAGLAEEVASLEKRKADALKALRGALETVGKES